MATVGKRKVCITAPPQLARPVRPVRENYILGLSSTDQILQHRPETIIMSKRDKLTASFAQVDESKEGFVPIEKVGEGWRAAYRPQRHIRPVRPLTTTPLFPNHPRRSGAR